MEIEHFPIAGPIHFTMPRFEDERGYFTETFNLQKLLDAGVAEKTWVQDNQSLSVAQFTLRGLHYQMQPCAQAKIVKVAVGRVFDVAVDIRPRSSTFGQWLGVELAADKMNQLYIPEGFAHGFLTLTPNVIVTYKVSNHYSRAHDRSLNWADPSLAIRWPLAPGHKPVLSEKDEAAPQLYDLKSELEAVS